MKRIIFIGPDDGAVMMVSAVFLSQSNRLGEASVPWIISDQQWVGFGFAVPGRLRIPVVYDIELIVQENRLRALSAIIQHLEFSVLTER